MTQEYREIQASDTLGDSRGYINDSNEALVTLHAGTSAPTSTYPYMLWADTTNGLLKQRTAADDAWVTVATLGAATWGLLSKAGGTMTGVLDMGGQQITNVGLGTGTAVARQQEVDLKAPLAAPALTGDATVDQDPAGNNSIIRRVWAEARYLKLAGGTATGAISSTGYGAGAAEFVPLYAIQQLVTFHTSIGHRHDGSDARKVLVSSLNSSTEADGSMVTADGSGGIAFVKGAKAMVFGRVSAAGAKVLEGGAGFTVSKTGTGTYTITISGGVFSVSPMVLGNVEGSEIGTIDIVATSATTITVEIGYLHANIGTGAITQVNQDGAFAFLAME